MSNVVDINEDQFVNEVIEKSKTIPVIVDFWAHGVVPVSS